MVNLNKVLVAGNLTRDPEVRYTPSGLAVADIDLAINNYFLSKDGTKKSETVFINIVVWGKQAESLKNYVTKGFPLLVEGRLQLDSWQTKEGEKRSKLKIVAQRIQFLKGINKEFKTVEKQENTGEINNNILIEEDDIPY